MDGGIHNEHPTHTIPPATVEALCQPRLVCSPKTRQTKVETPGQDEGHPEVVVLHRSLLRHQLVLVSTEPEVLQAHSVLQTVAGVGSEEAEV